LPDSDFYEAKKRVKRTAGDGRTLARKSRKPVAVKRPPVNICEIEYEGDYDWQIWTSDDVKLLKELEKGQKSTYSK
jgi:hypothetical protein